MWDAHPEYDLGEIERAFKARFTWEERQAMLILSPDEIEYMLSEKWPSLAGQRELNLKTGMAGVETAQATRHQTNPIAPRWTFRVRTH